MAEISMKYKGIEIEYCEDDNKWHFEFRGKERVMETLANAKKCIDTQPKEKVDFIPQSALLVGPYNSEVVTVTSESAYLDYYQKTQFWIKDSKGRRSKESSSRLYSNSPANQQLLREAKSLDKEAELFNKKAEAKRKEMAPFVITS